jgi:hypothetical protein
VEPEKIYKKNFDGLYLFFDYPLQKKEIEELAAKGENSINLILNIKQKVNWPQ